MQHFQKMVAYLEGIEKYSSGYTLTEGEVTEVHRLFYLERNIANKKRRKLENEVWKVRTKSNNLLKEEAGKEASLESAKYLGHLIRDRIHTVQTESTLFEAFDLGFLSERAMVLERFALYGLQPERQHR